MATAVTDWPSKDPQERREYGIDFTDEINPGDAIVSTEWVIEDGLVKLGERADGLLRFVTLEGGEDGRRYRALCIVTTAAGERIPRSRWPFVILR